jgi:hypothetical protein
MVVAVRVAHTVLIILKAIMRDEDFIRQLSVILIWFLPIIYGVFYSEHFAHRVEAEQNVVARNCVEAIL